MKHDKKTAKHDKKTAKHDKKTAKHDKSKSVSCLADIKLGIIN